MEKRLDGMMPAAMAVKAADKVADKTALVSVEEAAEMLSLGRSVVCRLIMCNDVRSVKIGQCRRIVVSSLHEHVARLAGHVNQRACPSFVGQSRGGKR